jgi:hypothetical protein
MKIMRGTLSMIAALRRVFIIKIKLTSTFAKSWSAKKCNSAKGTSCRHKGEFPLDIPLLKQGEEYPLLKSET